MRVLDTITIPYRLYKGITHPSLRRIFELHKQYKIDHPALMEEEWEKVWQTGLGIIKNTLPRDKQWVKWAPHCHTTHSHDGRLKPGELVDLLFGLNTEIGSITDHGNQETWNELREGKGIRNGYGYGVHRDNRSLTIFDTTKDRRLTIPRSIEYMTEDGEIGIHGISEDFPATERLPLTEAIHIATDLGGFVAINHVLFWAGIGWTDCKEAGLKVKDKVLEAKKAGAIAIELNGTEGWPQYHSSVAARIFANPDTGVDLALIATDDAHDWYMLGKSGVGFERKSFMDRVLEESPIDIMRDCLTSGEYENFFNYLHPLRFLQFFRFGARIR